MSLEDGGFFFTWVSGHLRHPVESRS